MDKIKHKHKLYADGRKKMQAEEKTQIKFLTPNSNVYVYRCFFAFLIQSYTFFYIVTNTKNVHNL